MKNKLISWIVFMFLFSGCTYSKTQIKAVDHRPTIVIQNAPQGSLLYVNGLKIGNAVEYNGKPQSLTIESGAHQVEIRSSSKALIYKETIFVEGEQKTIKVH